MGLIGKVIGSPTAISTLAGATRDVVRVFRPDATRGMELAHESGQAALGQFGAEFVLAPQGWFDRLVNGLNRLPRPMLALGTLGLFVHAMADPDSFAVRMQGLQHVPEPLWWLLGAIVAFYFGARETHYRRILNTTATTVTAEPDPDNPALTQFLHQGGDR